MLSQNLVNFFETSLKENWNRKALSDYNGATLTYAETAEKILYLQFLYGKMGIKKDDKIVLLGKNSVNWAISYLSIVTYGAVVVPILPDFKPDDVHHIVNHSDSVLMFAHNSLYEELDCSCLKNLKAVISMDDFSLHEVMQDLSKPNLEKAINKYRAEAKKITPDQLDFPKVGNEKLASIVYTSGTTGFSKGVMLPHNSLISNIVYAQENMPLKAEDRILSFLPIAHAFGCAFEFLFPFCSGCHITFLNKMPSPKILVKAFGEIKPNLILSVPLILEKIYRKQLKPVIDKKSMQIMLKIPGLNLILHKKIREKLTSVFGGEFHEIVIGGAALNKEVELFLKKIKFRYTVGYGMTECGPLISYRKWYNFKLASCGMLVDQLDIKIASNDPYNIAGEIMVKGENVMYGYYKNEEATKASFEGKWLKTGDIGIIDHDKTIYIKGRSKSMILGPSGKNIYPEELEAIMNNLPYVSESIVIDKDGQLVALVYPDMEAADSNKKSETDLKGIMEANRQTINKRVPAYMAVQSVQIWAQEFEKTPKRSIKRYLYTN